MNGHPALWGVLVDIEEGRLVRARGDKENPDSRGFLCVRGQASHEISGNAKRLATNTRLYLMEQALPPPGETRPLRRVLRGLAQCLQLEGFFPWNSQEGLSDAVPDSPGTGYATGAALRQEGGVRLLQASRVAYPD